MRVEGAADLETEVPIEELGLTTRAYRCLKRAGVHTIARLSQLGDRDLLEIRSFGQTSLDDVRLRLGQWKAHGEPQPTPSVAATSRRGVKRSGRTPLSVSRGAGTPSPAELLPEQVIAELRLTEREWQVLNGRYGLVHQLTLEQIGGRFDVTRERIRQIAKAALRKLDQKARRSGIELLSHRLESALSMREELEPDELLSRLQGLLLAESGKSSQPDTVLRIALVLRALTAVRPAEMRAVFPNLSYMAAFARPAILAHKDVAMELGVRAGLRTDANRHWTYAVLAQAVLADSPIPLHWREAVRRAEALGHRKSFSVGGFANVLFGRDDLFARVAPGTYALRERGHEDARFYPDLIEEALTALGRPASRGEIGASVGQSRPIKPASLQMFLDLNPRFYESVDGLYGLRGWLPDEHRQTLRTPRTHVEAARSKRRLSSGHLRPE